MNARVIVPIIIACVFGSGLLGFLLGKVLPERHLTSASKEIVQLATGLTATLAALALGLLVSSAKGTFDEVGDGLTAMAGKAVLLDRVLARYGPATTAIRADLKRTVSRVVDDLASGDEARQANLDTPASYEQFEELQANIEELKPENDAQRRLQSRALQIAADMNSSRWLLSMRSTGSISMPLVATLVLWLSLVFAAWGVFAPRNLVVTVALFACALSVSGAVFLIMEMDQPLSGWIRVSTIPLQKAVAHLGE
jgi:hypothetical protein